MRGLSTQKTDKLCTNSKYQILAKLAATSKRITVHAEMKLSKIILGIMPYRTILLLLIRLMKKDKLSQPVKNLALPAMQRLTPMWLA